MRRILLTGATGFVGKQVLKSLAKEDVSIRVITRGTQDHFFSQYENVSEVIHCLLYTSDAADE